MLERAVFARIRRQEVSQSFREISGTSTDYVYIMHGTAAQEAARTAAAEELAKERGGWLGKMGFRVAQSFASAAAGAHQQEERSAGARVGQRKRAVRWNDQVATGRGGTVPNERALVPVMSKVPDL